jgi:arylsulfatase A-like enzyme
MLTEETMRIPLVVRWPGVAEAGKVSGALASNMDIVPTVLEMGGSAVPEYMDGQSLVPLLCGGEITEWRQELMAEHYGHKNFDGIQRVLYFGNYKYVAHQDDSDELYDLSRDPFEWNNLIDEPLMGGTLADLKEKLAKRMERYGDLADDSQRLIEQKRMLSMQEDR